MHRHTVSLAALLLSSMALAAPPEGAAPMPMPRFNLKPVMKGTGPTGASPYKKEQVARGEYLSHVADCQQCHTAKVFDAKMNMPMPDLTRVMAGHPEGAPDPYSALAPGDSLVIGPTFTSFRSPFGVAYAMNLTPDVETGLGGWTEQQFISAIRTGKHLGSGRPILPPMPWAFLAKASDEDLRSIFAYLRSLPPVRNVVPQVTLPDPALKAVMKANSMMMAP